MTTAVDGTRALARGMRAPRVLVVDDEASLRELLELTLVGMGLDVDVAANLADARRWIAERRYALCLTDMRLPDGNGLELVGLIGQQSPDTPVAVITAFGSAENAVAALKAGAFDYLAKPVGLDALRSLVRSALRPPGASGLVEAGSDAAAFAGAGRAVAAGRADAGSDGSGEGRGGHPGGHAAAGTPVRDGAAGFVGPGGIVDAAAGGRPGGIVGAGSGGGVAGGAGGLGILIGAGAQRVVTLLGVSPAIAEVRATIARMARSMAPVSITGESGSGKEVAARLIHQSGTRASGPFVAVNCGAIPEALMESEFFGYRKGAFTGADADRDGFFAAADGGTLFLDEVADLPLAMQVKLLRAIQEKRIRKVGSVSEEPVDVRIISATHQDLAQCVAEGRFRQDLFYRLNVIELRLPPLRERREDVAALADSILERLARRAGLPQTPRLSSVTLRFLESYRFPGNVRELENILERALAFSDGRVVNVEDLGLRPTVVDDGERERANVGDEVRANAGRSDGVRPEPDRLDPGRPDARLDAARLDPGRSPTGRDLGPRAADAPDGREPGSPADATGDRLNAVPDDGVDADGVPRSLPDYLDRIEREAILRALERTRQNRTAAARLLGITFRALRYRMQRLQIR